MMDRAEREPTMEEIVVALRETGRSAGRMPPFTVVGGQPGGIQTSGAAPHSQGAPADIADLRDSEIERLLTENARLNQRVMFLLKVIEREQTGHAEHASIATDHSANFHDMRAALEAELRPVLLVLLRLVEKQRADPDGPVVEGVRQARRETAPHDADGIVDLDAPRF